MGVVTGGSETISFTEGFEMTESIILEVFGKTLKEFCNRCTGVNESFFWCRLKMSG